MFGGGQGQIWLDNMNCNGSELFISECSTTTGPINWGVQNCDHRSDAGVVCNRKWL